MIDFKSYKSISGETLLYTGSPNLKLLNDLVKGPGDVWHSSYHQGFANCFPELVYQTSVYWWFLNDVEQHKTCINWRINYRAFVIRKSVWDAIGQFSNDFEGEDVIGLDLGFNLIRNHGGIPLYVKELFVQTEHEVVISAQDRYLFYLRNFKKKHSYYMLFRQNIWRLPKEYLALKQANNKRIDKKNQLVKPRKLKPIVGNPTVSLVIPTMKRQAFTELLLEDHNAQTYLIKEAIIVDATPESERNSIYYNQHKFKFDIKVKWQTSQGSCKARNEAIAMCTGDYIIFADDDIRIMPDFVENHIRLLQTYNAQACNGLDIMANNTSQSISDLKAKLNQIGAKRWKVGVSHMFSNANSCVKKSLVDKLIGNDINFDGGYGEDTDFGHRIIKAGKVLLHNPFSPNLHLKPTVGGYRFWGSESMILGNKRKPQPWELNKPVRFIRPKPSPTMTYLYIKHFNRYQLREWCYRYFFMYLFTGKITGIPLRLLRYPLRLLQFKKSVYYAKRLLEIGPRY